MARQWWRLTCIDKRWYNNKKVTHSSTNRTQQRTTSLEKMEKSVNLKLAILNRKFRRKATELTLTGAAYAAASPPKSLK